MWNGRGEFVCVCPCVCGVREKGGGGGGHWTKTYIPTTLGIHWVCIGKVLNPAN